MRNANLLLEGAAKAEAGTPGWAEVRRRLGFEMNGLVLHEYYFGNLASGSELSPGSNLADDVGTAWRAGFHPVLVLDVFEHAFMGDYGASGRADYIAAFLENVNREVVEQRHKDSKAGRFTARF